MPRSARLLAVALFCAAAIAAFAQAQKRSITEKDIFQFNWIGDPQISPDGSRVAFVKVTVDEKKTGYNTAIWSVSMRGDEQPRRMTDGKHDSSPRWSTDGKWLVFVRAPEPAGPAAMGTGEMAVTDPTSMKVHGTEGLRVVDASVMPYVTNGNIYAPVMMIAEKAADLILGNTPLPAEHLPFYRHGAETLP